MLPFLSLIQGDLRRQEALRILNQLNSKVFTVFYQFTRAFFVELLFLQLVLLFALRVIFVAAYITFLSFDVIAYLRYQVRVVISNGKR